jgi:general secretion pathway protein N
MSGSETGPSVAARRRPRLPRVSRVRAAVSQWRWRPAALGAALLAGGVAVLAVLLVQAPAVWLDRGLSQLSQGRVRLAQTQGTVWHGQGRLVLVDLGDARQGQSELGGRLDQPGSGDPPWRSRMLAGLTLPGEFFWRLKPGSLLQGRVDLELRHSSQAQAIMLSAGLSGIALQGGALSLPGLALERLGSPWNSLRPTASLHLSWDDWRLTQGRAQGRLVLELSGVASALTPVRPLGAYRGELVSSGEQARVNLSTLAGPLRLEGSGRWSVRSGLSLQASAWADPVEQDRLLPLLSLMGRREGNRTIIRLGA